MASISDAPREILRPAATPLWNDGHNVRGFGLSDWLRIIVLLLVVDRPDKSSSGVDTTSDLTASDVPRVNIPLKKKNDNNHWNNDSMNR